MENHSQVAETLHRLAEETNLLAAQVGALTYGPQTEPHQEMVAAAHTNYSAATGELRKAVADHLALCTSATI